MSEFSIDKILEKTGDAIGLFDAKMKCLWVNNAFSLLYGLKPEDFIGKTAIDVYPDFEKSVFYEAAIQTIKTNEQTTRIGYSNNLKEWMLIKALKYDAETYIWCAQRVLNSNIKNAYISKHDPLTSIYNRFSLEETLEEKIRKNSELTLFLVDVLKFKSINDSFGVTQGDMILMEFAARLKRCLGKETNIYRYNADQFAVVLDSIDQNEINEIINKIQESKKEAFTAQSNQFFIDLAIGYGVVNNFTISFQDIITHCEMALNKAKKTKNKTAVQFDEKEILLGNKEKLILVNEFKKALKENNSLVLYYQRQIDCSTKKICGAEALIRWNHPTKGFISPAQFLPIAEEFDLMFDLDKYVFVRAIKDMYEFKKKGIELPVAINLSSASLCNPKIVELFETVLNKIDINRSLLTIEITESAFIEEKEISKKIVDDIKSLGMKVALDDFCTGYSSMEYLLSYPADYLKIDREFIRNIDEDQQRRNIVKGLITMAHSLNMSVIAEGVENKEEANSLVTLNCDCIQGFFFGKPQEISEIINAIEVAGYTKQKGVEKINNDNTNSVTL